MATKRVYPGTGYHTLLTPENSPLGYSSFSLLSLDPKEYWEGEFESEETLFVLFSGHVQVWTEGVSIGRIGNRTSMIEGAGFAIYLPPNHRFSLTALDHVEACFVRARARERLGEIPILVTPKQVREEVRGRGRMRQIIRHYTFGMDTQYLNVGETVGQKGGWLSFPPHVHKVEQFTQEEIYHLHLEPEEGFVLMGIYGTPREESFLLRNRDTVAITDGFHPIAVPPGQRAAYLWVFCGPRGQEIMADDPFFKKLVARRHKRPVKAITNEAYSRE